MAAVRLTNYEGGEDFAAESVHAVLGEYESASVTLPSGHVVRIFTDKIYVRDPGVDRHQDGQQIWTAHAGIEPLEPCPECGRPVGRTRSGKVRPHGTVVVDGGLHSYPTCTGSGTELSQLEER